MKTSTPIFHFTLTRVFSNIKFILLICVLGLTLPSYAQDSLQHWNLTGNEGTEDGTNFIGTTDFVPMRIRANNEDRIIIDPAGSVTLGSEGNYIITNDLDNTVSIYSGYVRTGYFDPTAIEYTLLPIVKIGDVDDIGLGMTLTLNDTATPIFGGVHNFILKASITDNGFGGILKVTSADKSAEATILDSMFQMSGSHILGQKWNSEAHAFNIYSFSHDSLIFSTPLKYDVGTLGAGKILTSDANGFATWQPVTNSGWGLGGNAGTNSSTNLIGTTDNRSLKIATNNVSRVFIDSLGKVGVGTTSPLAKMQINSGSTASLKIVADSGVKAIQVNKDSTNNFTVYSDGRVFARDVTVYASGTTFPDYVFDSNYKMRSLPELEKFVNDNKHLPNIPTAAEVDKNGLSVGKMQEKLLEKIEEISLYLIDLNKKDVELNKEIQALRTKNAELESKLQSAAIGK